MDGDPDGNGNVAARSSHSSTTAVYNFWKDFELEAFRHKLDEQGLTIAENQELSLKSRRKLAETTRDVKRKASPEVLKEVGALMKLYQEEVDKLSNRAKFGEAAFLDVYQKLYEAPDPAPHLAFALEVGARAAEMEAAAAKLAGELAEYKAESRQLRNQEHTIRRLEERARTLEAQLEEKDRLLEEAKAASADAAGALAAEMDAMRENTLTAALAEARASLAALQRQHEAGQKSIAELQARSEEEAVGLQAQLEIAGAEVERAHARLAALEMERERAAGQAKLPREETSPTHNSRSSNSAEQALRAELSSQRELTGRLHAEVAALSERASADAAGWAERCEGLRQALAAQQAHTAALEAQLSSRPTTQQVEQLQAQVRVLQAVGYGAVETDDAGGPGPGAADSLEAALLGKARRLEHDLTMARLRIAELAGMTPSDTPNDTPLMFAREAEAAGARAAEAEAEVAAGRSVIQRLEDDLLAAQREALAKSGSGVANSSSFAELGGEEGPLEAASNGGSGGGERTMIGVICAQRDRLKARVAQLEEDNSRVSAEAKLVLSQLEAAKSDNVALVERLRYVQGYQSQSRRKDVGPGDVESRYTREYEEALNPFTDFRDRERSARKRQLSPVDRVLFEIGQIVSGSKGARLVVMVYVVALHMLVFWVMARWSHRHAGAGHMGAAELALLCQRQGDGSASHT
ncbi:Protein CASP [Coccomyxa sp. Obi]|nr:Protein CASP [Coccomyxa sp. Obi]